MAAGGKEKETKKEKKKKEVPVPSAQEPKRKGKLPREEILLVLKKGELPHPRACRGCLVL